ncbi:hypothetical protein, conserved [Eimeria maxima]|uniref:Uncharacterized protein n=1 Tax=Eimeria maxima TaxID=5804 RepID=U6MB36_EIMMA|nr:hypothetical protein, conserved [Eimeria maxima]CDJ60263.1 hypothetical protein, conserved [Eimeria maxima]
MKAVGLLAAGSSNGPLQELKKKAKAKKDKSADGVEDTRSSKRDPVKEYMEQQFYKQFLPKRDFNSRIRKLALDKDTLRRAQGNSKKEVFIAAADRLGTHNGPVSFARPVVPARPPLAAVYKGAGAGRCWLLCVSESYLENTEQ